MSTTARYAEVCRKLGFDPDVNFVKLLPGGAIGFTCGKPEEIRSLVKACRREGMKLGSALKKAADRS